MQPSHFFIKHLYLTLVLILLALNLSHGTEVTIRLIPKTPADARAAVFVPINTDKGFFTLGHRSSNTKIISNATGSFTCTASISSLNFQGHVVHGVSVTTVPEGKADFLVDSSEKKGIGFLSIDQFETVLVTFVITGSAALSPLASLGPSNPGGEVGIPGDPQAGWISDGGIGQVISALHFGRKRQVEITPHSGKQFFSFSELAISLDAGTDFDNMPYIFSLQQELRLDVGNPESVTLVGFLQTEGEDFAAVGITFLNEMGGEGIENETGLPSCLEGPLRSVGGWENFSVVCDVPPDAVSIRVFIWGIAGEEDISGFAYINVYVDDIDLFFTYPPPPTAPTPFPTTSPPVTTPPITSPPTTSPPTTSPPTRPPTSSPPTTIPPTPSPPTPPPVDLGGRIWRDDNEDGVQDVDEEGIEGVAVFFFQNGHLIATKYTRTDGGFLSPVTPNQDTFVVVLSSDPHLHLATISPKNSIPDSELDSDALDLQMRSWIGVRLTPTSDELHLGFGFILPVTTTSTITGRVFKDTNGDGIQNFFPPEEGISNVPIILYNAVDMQPRSYFYTSSSGQYSIDVTPDTTFYLFINMEDLPQYTPTSPNVGNDDEVDSDGVAQSNGYIRIVVNSPSVGKVKRNVDFGFIPQP